MRSIIYKLIIPVLFVGLIGVFFYPAHAQSILPDSVFTEESLSDSLAVVNEEISPSGIHRIIKEKFIEGSVFFMSLIVIAMIAGLAFCLERIIYLNLSQINTKKFLIKIEDLLLTGNVEEAKELARHTRGPVASIVYQGLLRIREDIDVIEKSIVSYGSVQAGLLEKNFSWISLFISMAPSLGFLGTVIGMIQAFDDIQQQGDIGPGVVAGGMKVALITTVGGLIVALILQLFYNYVLTKEEGILSEMEDASISLLDMIIKYKYTFQKQ